MFSHKQEKGDRKTFLDRLKMFDTFFTSKFHAKCKSYIKVIKTRLGTIKKKRYAVENYLKNDVADLLKSNLDINAYGRAEGLLVEQTRTPCYNLIEQFCDCILNHLSVMDKQRECPEECREAVASLIYAAARFSDLPELRDLRTLFAQKFGNSVDSYINKEFYERLRAKPPAKEMKLQLLHDIAHELSIDWDSKALEQRLFCPSPPPDTALRNHQLSDNEDDDKLKRCKVNNDDLLKQDDGDTEYELSNFRGSESNARYKPHSSSEDEEATVSSRSSTDLDGLKSSSSIASVSEDDADSKRPLPYRFIPPPYLKQKKQDNKELKEVNGRSSYADEEENQQNESPSKPRSVRRRPLKPPPGHKDACSVDTNRVSHKKYGRHSTQSTHADVDNQRDEDKRLDEDLDYYSKIPSPYPPVDDIIDTRRRPARGTSLPPEPTSPKMPTKIHSRASSLQPDMLAGHVHPKLPEYDDLAARLAALRGK